jgi:hypothetical protein
MANNEEILSKIKILEDLYQEAIGKYEYLVLKRNKDDLQHQILLLSLSRACKYFNAYLMLIKNGFGEPAVNLVRSLFETSLWMRWVIIDRENAKKYHEAGKGEAVRIANLNVGRGLAKLDGVDNPELAKKMLADESRKNRLPEWKDLAKDTGMMDLYAIFYKYTSAMCHGTLLFLGERIENDKTFSPYPDNGNILPYIPMANNIFRDCALVAEIWIMENKIREVPNVKKLYTPY